MESMTIKIPSMLRILTIRRNGWKSLRKLMTGYGNMGNGCINGKRGCCLPIRSRSVLYKMPDLKRE